MDVNLGGGRNIKCLSVWAFYDTQLIYFFENSVGQNPIAKGKEILIAVPAQLAYALGCVCLGVQVFLDAVEFVYFGKPYIVAQ